MNSKNQNISIIDFNKICRICMSEGNLVNIFSHCESEDCIFEMLACCTLTMVSEKDELPDKICLQCLDELKVAYKFYQKSEASDNRLHKLLEKSKQSDQAKNSPSTKSKIQLNRMQSVLKNKIAMSTVQNSPSTKSKIQLNRMQSVLKNKIAMSTVQNETIVDLDSDSAFNNTVHTDHDYILSEQGTCEKENQNTTDTDRAAHASKPLDRYNHECSRCHKSGFTYFELRMHWMAAHGAAYAERECEVCKQLIGYREFNKHIQSHPQYKPFACDSCDAAFRYKSLLVRHKVSHEKPFSCDKCEKRFARLGSLQIHVTKQRCISKNTGILTKKGTWTAEGYVCKVCDRHYQTKASLYQHSLIHGDKKYLCWYCGKSFTTGGGLLTHVKTHTGVRPFRCSYCPKTFIQSRGLKLHTYTHTGEKPYICEFCSKSFTQIHHLKNHVPMHTGVKPHKCSQCEKCYVSGSRLRIHMRTHTGIRPYGCEECGKAFFNSNHLRKHLKMHARLQATRAN